MNQKRIAHMIEREEHYIGSLQGKDLSRHGHWDMGYHQGRLSVLEAMEGSPWIPVGERTPDAPGDYWVTMRHLDGNVTTEKMFWKPDWPHEDSRNEVVVAWQPYYCPEPYRPETLREAGMEGGAGGLMPAT